MTFPIRPALAEDSADLGALFADTGMFAPEEADGLLEMFVHDMTSGAEPRRWQVIGDGGHVIAATCLSPEPLQDDVFNLLFLGVLSDHRGGGLAQALIAEAEAAAKAADARVMLIETASGDAFAPARGLYAKLGYAKDGKIRDYYADGIDKIVFRKRL